MPSRTMGFVAKEVFHPAQSLQAITAVDGDIFVRWAYITLLGRPADEAGLAFYLRRMREGKTKVSILKQLRRSPEGRAFGAHLPGLEGAIRRAMLERAPLIGPVYQRLRGGAEQPRQILPR
ncbi:DUF4214 domain-containing protein [Sphingobium sp. AP49]|uniref:DUF4214 domain-containing protein n=1 Tax=Sphingobium sp. AP49 TaxID=1144307 RepID=UPI00026EE547|nr:DUF4214 domain-containing protein [Sphingobium sp. AP49]WHO40197.1 DUF4214 domain-containing protein [Sphingobium sp. AP49]